MFRALREKASSGCTPTTSVLPETPSRWNMAAVLFVLPSPASSLSTTVTTPSRSFCASAARSAPIRTFFGRSNS